MRRPVVLRFDTEHLLESADGSLSPFRYYVAQREAVETLMMRNGRASAGFAC